MATSPRKKIGLIFAGGTTYIDNRGQRLLIKREKDVDRWLTGLPELQIIADVEPVFVFGEGVGALTSTEWHELAGVVAKLYPRVDGIVVLLSDKSFMYSVSALALALGTLGKPVVVTGPSLPSTTKKTAGSQLSHYHNLGVRANLLNAAHVAIANIAELVVVMGSSVLRGATLVRGAADGESYVSAEKPLGRIDFGVSLGAGIVTRAERRLTVRARFNPAVHVIEYHPTGLHSLKLDPRSVAGLIVTIDDLRRMTPAFRTELLQLKKKGIIPVIYTRGARSSDDRQLLIVNDMTLETTLVKLMWALGQTTTADTVAKLMRKEYTNEKLKRPRL